MQVPQIGLRFQASTTSEALCVSCPSTDSCTKYNERYALLSGWYSRIDSLLEPLSCCPAPRSDNLSILAKSHRLTRLSDQSLLEKCMQRVPVTTPQLAECAHVSTTKILPRFPRCPDVLLKLVRWVLLRCDVCKSVGSASAQRCSVHWLAQRSNAWGKPWGNVHGWIQGDALCFGRK